jgi:hypothetical protein
VNVDLSVLTDDEEVVHRSPANYGDLLLTKKCGSLILTPERVLFLTPPHSIAR